MKVSTLQQLKSQAKHLENLIKIFPTVRSLVRKWVFELTVVEGKIDNLESQQPESPKQLTIWDVKPMPKAPKEAVEEINAKFSFSTSQCKAVLWQKHGRTRIYLKAVDHARHLQDFGFVEWTDGKWTFDEVGGFGDDKEKLEALIS